MSKPYVVKAVAEQTREWSGKGGGTFLSYSVDFEDPVGIIQQSVEWSRKPESRPPTAGEEVVGEIQEGRFGPKFKLDFEATKELQGGTRQNASQPSSRPSGGSKGSWQPESERDPERAARILRQHSQEMAIRFMSMLGKVPQMGKAQEALTELIDWFDQDVHKAGQAASQGAGRAKEARSDSSPAPPDSPPARPEPGDEEKSMLKDIDMAILEVPGADLMAADARYQIGLYMLSELQEADRDRALNQLCNKGSMEGQIATLDAMKKRTEKWTGHRLPQPVEDPLDDVPF